jgi:adenine-specific DNA-methyltransferase
MPNIEITKPELIWPGKYDEEGNRVIDRGVALPFQVVETIREGRATREPGHISDLFSAKPSGHDEWRNKLIWGDNLLVMASLMESLRGRDLIYIDPPLVPAPIVSCDCRRRTITKEPSSSKKKHTEHLGRHSTYLSKIAPEAEVVNIWRIPVKSFCERSSRSSIKI